jgi:hypothetical protein
MRLRVTIRGLSVLVLLLGFGFAALRGATLGWATASILAALLTLCASTLGAVVRGGPSRPAWLGFAIFGWAYFLLHFGPGAEWKRGYSPAHFTTWAIDGLLLPRLAPELEEGRAVGGVEEFVILRSGKSGSFFCAASHALASLLFGLLGSALGLALSRRDDRPEVGHPAR